MYYQEPEKALRAALLAANLMFARYLSVYREGGGYAWNVGDSRWACEVLAGDPHFTWELLDIEQLIGEDEGVISPEELTNRELSIVVASPDWEEFIGKEVSN